MPSLNYRTGNYIVLDFETTSLEHGTALNPKNRLLLACGRDSQGKEFHCWGGELAQAALIRRLPEYDFIIAHNAKFELGWLRRCGVNLHDLIVFDTQIAQKVIAGNRPWPVSLEAVAVHYQLPGKEDIVHRLIAAGVNPQDISPKMLLAYCRQDVRLTAQIACAQIRRMSDKQLAVLQTRCELTPVLADIEFYGIGIDSHRVAAAYQHLTTAATQALRELITLAPGVLLTSSQQTSEYLYGTLGIPELTDRHGNPRRTATGRPQTDAATLTALKPPTAAGRKWIAGRLAYAKLQAALTKCVTKLHAAGDGPLFAKFNQTVTRTDRLSSTGRPPANIQLQNMAREYKRLFRARGGHVFVEADASQLEFRVAVSLANDAAGMKAIREHVDVHMETAAVIAGDRWPSMGEAARKAYRTRSKQHTFKPLYGGQSGTPKERAYYEWFRTQYAGITNMQRGWVADVIKRGYLETAWGTVYHWAAVKPKNDGYVNEQRQIFNYPIQALATAEILPIILRGIWDDFHQAGLQSRVINTVHDSILCEVLPEELDAVRKLIVANFTESVYSTLKSRYDLDFKVPLAVELKIGDHWGEGKTEVYEAQL